MSIRYSSLFITIGFCLGVLMQTSPADVRVRVEEQTLKSEGEQDRKIKKIILENELYRTTLVPDIARLPLSLTFKVTGHNMFANPTPLSTPPGDGFVNYGGLIDAIPWVSGKAGEKRLPTKGYLHHADWTWNTGSEKDTAWFEGEAEFTYQDPADKRTSTLLFRKRMTAHSRSTELKMDYVIRNTGATTARFALSIHTRAAIAECDEGDFFFAPGNKAYVLYYQNLPDLSERLVKEGKSVPCWTEWPIQGATTYRPAEESANVFAAIPSHWCAMGDDKNEESLFFVASPVRYDGSSESMKMGIHMASHGYVVEPCLTYNLVGDPESWTREDPPATLSLKPGRECAFSLSLVPYEGISREDMKDIQVVYPEVVLLDRPEAVETNGTVTIRGRIAGAVQGRVELRAPGQPVAAYPVLPGITPLEKLSWHSIPKGPRVSLYFCTIRTERKLADLVIPPVPDRGDE